MVAYDVGRKMIAWLVDGQILAALITAGGIVVAAVIASQSIESYRKQKSVDNENHSHQKEIDRKEEVAKRQRAEYERYFELFWLLETVKAGTEEHAAIFAEYQSVRDNLAFYTSDEGLRKVSEFHKYIVDHPKAEDKDLDVVKDLYASMILALRKDCYGETDLTAEQIRSWLTITI
jgi:hypothetical protein